MSDDESALWAAMLTGADDAMLDAVVSDSMIDAGGIGLRKKEGIKARISKKMRTWICNSA